MENHSSHGTRRPCPDAAPKRPVAGPVSLVAALPYLAGIALVSRRWKQDRLGGVARRVQHTLHPHGLFGAKR